MCVGEKKGSEGMTSPFFFFLLGRKFKKYLSSYHYHNLIQEMFVTKEILRTQSHNEGWCFRGINSALQKTDCVSFFPSCCRQ